MLCRDLMKSEVHCVSMDATVSDAAKLMRDEQIGFLPICDEEKNVIGILTDRDIAVRVVADNRSLDEPVASFMTPEIVACRSEDDLSVAQELMGELQVSRIICLNEDGELDGVISLSDIAQVEDNAAVTLRNVSVREART